MTFLGYVIKISRPNSCYRLCSAHCALGTVSINFERINSLNPQGNLMRRHRHYTHFTDEETEAQRGDQPPWVYTSGSWQSSLTPDSLIPETGC